MLLAKGKNILSNDINLLDLWPLKARIILSLKNWGIIITQLVGEMQALSMGPTYLPTRKCQKLGRFYAKQQLNGDETILSKQL